MLQSKNNIINNRKNFRGGEHVNVCLLLMLFWLVPFAGMAQDSVALKPNKIVESTFSAGVGSSNVLDTYLSPLNYKGTELRLQYDRFRLTKMMGGKVGVQYQYSLFASNVKNDAKTAEEWAGMAYAALGYFYNANSQNAFGVKNLSVMFGPQAEFGFGGVYNDRNSNNPANAKVYLDLKASAMVKYKLEILNYPLSLSNQISVPLVGLAFSPEYQQSYYEIFGLGYYGGVVNPTTFVSRPSLRNQFSADFPLNSSLIRISYLFEADQLKVNNLKFHSYSNIFMIGYVKHLFRLRGKYKK